jgi:hypothetical protein
VAMIPYNFLFLCFFFGVVVYYWSIACILSIYHSFLNVDSLYIISRSMYNSKIRLRVANKDRMNSSELTWC